MYRKVQEVMRKIADLHSQVFDRIQVEQVSYDVPAELTREVYIQVIKRVLACVRRELYFKIQGTKPTAEEVDVLLETIQQGTQEEYRAQALFLYKITIPEGENPKRLMQKAYLNFSTAPTERKLGQGFG
jgi:hypothetical protein